MQKNQRGKELNPFCPPKQQRQPLPSLLYLSFFYEQYHWDELAHVWYIRAEKAEEEVADLVKKSQQLEVDLDKTSELLMTTTQQLEEKEKALLGISRQWHWH